MNDKPRFLVGETIPARMVSKLKYVELIREFTKED